MNAFSFIVCFNQPAIAILPHVENIAVIICRCSFNDERPDTVTGQVAPRGPAGVGFLNTLG